MLTNAQREVLLAVARSTIRAATGDTAPPPPPSPERIEGTCGGVFVTLKRSGELRGCIGHFRETTDLIDSVCDTAEAALGDSRFADNPVTASEIGDLEIEISLLSARTPMKTIEELTPGRHGVYICRGHRSGCFLPKVASERGWSAEQFLSHCCTMKAGLDADAWKDPATQVQLFTAEVFSDRSGHIERE